MAEHKDKLNLPNFTAVDTLTRAALAALEAPSATAFNLSAHDHLAALEAALAALPSSSRLTTTCRPRSRLAACRLLLLLQRDGAFIGRPDWRETPRAYRQRQGATPAVSPNSRSMGCPRRGGSRHDDRQSSQRGGGGEEADKSAVRLLPLAQTTGGVAVFRNSTVRR